MDTIETGSWYPFDTNTIVVIKSQGEYYCSVVIFNQSTGECFSAIQNTFIILAQTLLSPTELSLKVLGGPRINSFY